MKAYTLTFSPSLDYYINCDDIAFKEVTRAKNVRYELGGKGINVSRVLKTLGFDSTAIIITGGFVGAEIVRRCKELELDIINIETAANSRINVKFTGAELNAPVPPLTDEEINKLSAVLDTLTEEDGLIISGRIPENVDIKKVFGNRPFSLICDVSGQALIDFLSLSPLLIAPNDAEIAEIFRVGKIDDINKLISLAKKLLITEDVIGGAAGILLTLGSHGVMFIMPDKIIAIEPHMRKALNSVGAGDSCLAGFLAGAEKYESEYDVLRLANAAGAAAAFSEGLPTEEFIEELFNSEIRAVDFQI
ncbi:MAG: PfkB family carbohydrate kinase [Ruminococcus sp.]|jgi:1-phosphofructokinase|nr:PfkB family carbohydrate kinase [Ruminococcus sp.]